MASNETAIQSKIIDHLKKKEYFFVRLNNIPPFDPIQKTFRRMPKGSMKGLPDIMVLTDGGFVVFLEVKDKGKQSEDQKIFEQKCKEIGCEYHIVRSIDDVVEIGL